LSLEKGAGGAGAAALLAGDGTDMGGSDRMMQAILSQRDRFMKQAREREAELATLKGRFDKLQEEQFSLRQDNLELYRRQRAMRAGAGISTDVEQSTPSKDKTLVHFNCGLETLASTLLLNRDSALKDLDFLDVIKVDLSLVREWLYGTQRGASR
jgi:hypothetical protein